MVVKDIIDVDYINYQKPSMIIGFPTCDFKCDHECGKQVCQNCPLAIAPNIYINVGKVVVKYIKSSSKAICCQGLEPFDSWEDLQDLIYCLRTVGVNDDIVIYTGYYKEEIIDKVEYLKKYYSNIIIKFGRYIPGQEPHYDEVLGVKLASDNQYAERIS